MVVNLKLRGILSAALLVLFVVVTITGIGLLYAPHGRWASAGWSFMGMDKHTLETVHTYTGIAFAVLACIHIAINARMLVAELKH